MKKFIVLLYFSAQIICSYAQSDGYSVAFRKIYAACLSARSSLSDGLGSPDEMKQAYSSFGDVKWAALKLWPIDVKKEKSINGHFVFLPEYFNSLIVKHQIYAKAEEYQKEAERSTKTRGSEVMITTKAICKKSTVKYMMRATGTLEIGVVSEVDGLVSWKITVKAADGKITTYKDNQNEYKGMPSREKRIELSGGISVITIELTNTTASDKSYAIIVNS